MSVFRTKIAHTPLFSLGPNKELGELISSEKRLVDATQKLALERNKSSIALRDWGAFEGPDLGDVLTKMASLFDLLAKAETAFAEHDSTFRLHFKSIRTREENLAQLKRNQSSLASKIESQDKKVSKMKEENKDLPSAQQKLREMRQEMVGLENSVLNEETDLGDFKRITTREAMALKLGALLELAEKTVVVSEIGRLIIDEIPTGQTEPGAPRAQYYGYEKTESHMGEAMRCLGEVVFNPEPLSPRQDRSRGAGGEEAQWAPQGQGQGHGVEDDRWTGMHGQQPHQGQDWGGAGPGAGHVGAHEVDEDNRWAHEGAAAGGYGYQHHQHPGQQQQFSEPVQQMYGTRSSHDQPAYDHQQQSPHDHEAYEDPLSPSQDQLQSRERHQSLDQPRESHPDEDEYDYGAADYAYADRGTMYDDRNTVYDDRNPNNQANTAAPPLPVAALPSTTRSPPPPTTETEYAGAPAHAAAGGLPAGAGYGNNRSSLAYMDEDDEDEQQRRLQQEWADESNLAHMPPPKVDALPTLPTPPAPFAEKGISSPGSFYDEPLSTHQVLDRHVEIEARERAEELERTREHEQEPRQEEALAPRIEPPAPSPYHHQQQHEQAFSTPSQRQAPEPKPILFPLRQPEPYAAPAVAPRQQQDQQQDVIPTFPRKVSGSGPADRSALSSSTASAAGRPPVVRGDSALGSKHGDIFVPGTTGAVSDRNGAGPSTGPFQGQGTSGYNARSGESSSINSTGKGRIAAGAFRRPGPPQAQFMSTSGSIPDARYANLGGSSESRYPSEASTIRDQYYASTAAPVSNSVPAEAAPEAAREMLVGPRGTVVSPKFDVSPLHVQRGQDPPRGGPAPPLPTSSTYADNDFPSGPHQSWQSAQSATSSFTSPPPYVGGSGGQVPTSPGGQSGGGFGASRFVTKLD